LCNGIDSGGGGGRLHNCIDRDGGGSLSAGVNASRHLRIFRWCRAFIIRQLRLEGGTPMFGGAVGLQCCFNSCGGCLDGSVGGGSSLGH
jgi:hypothetical protein